MKKGDETHKREWWKSGNVKLKIEVMLQARKGTGKTLKVGCDMKGGRGGGFRWGKF